MLGYAKIKQQEKEKQEIQWSKKKKTQKNISFESPSHLRQAVQRETKNKYLNVCNGFEERNARGKREVHF